MSVFVIKNKIAGIDEENKLYSKLNYILRPMNGEYNKFLINGCAVNPYNAFSEIMNIKKIFTTSNCNACNGKYFYELILSLENGEKKYIKNFIDVIEKIDYFLSQKIGKYQVVSAIHNNTSYLHAHIIMSTTNYLTGERINMSLALQERIVDTVNEILGAYNLSLVKK